MSGDVLCLLTDTQAFEECQATTHWPNAAHVGHQPLYRNGELDKLDHDVPKSGRPQLSERGMKLTGIPYIKQ